MTLAALNSVARLIRLLGLVVPLLSALSMPAGAERFLHNDDYKDGEEVVGTFFTDDDYALLEDEVERNSTEFDWTWVATGRAEAVEPEPRKKGLLKRLRVPRGPRLDASSLAFDFADYSTVSIPEVQFDAGLAPLDFTAQVRELLGQVAGQLGLEVVDGEPAGLELSAAVVDFNSSGLHGIPFVGHVLPWVELEIRLLDVATGEPLLLVRHQEHANDPLAAVRDALGRLVRFLR